jgi:hypothetical protein
LIALQFYRVDDLAQLGLSRKFAGQVIGHTVDFHVKAQIQETEFLISVAETRV